MLADFFAKPMFQKIDISDVALMDVGQALGTFLGVSCDVVAPEKDALEFYLFTHVLSNFKQEFAVTQRLPGPVNRVLGLYDARVTRIAQRAFYYLLIICTRELRHARLEYNSMELYDYLRNTYGSEALEFFKLLLNADGYDSVRVLIDTEAKLSFGTYLKIMCDLFNNGCWGEGFGGTPWGRIATCLHDYCFGKMSLELLVDCIWTLAHNNGPIFNKDFVYQTYTKSLRVILDIQRSGQIPEFFCDFINGNEYCHPGAAYAVSLYKGLCKILHTPSYLTGYVDWWLVVGSHNNEYSMYKDIQINCYGMSPFANSLEIEKFLADSITKKSKITESFQVDANLKVPKKLMMREVVS